MKKPSQNEQPPLRLAESSKERVEVLGFWGFEN
jgi:hypothetical protein